MSIGYSSKLQLLIPFSLKVNLSTRWVDMGACQPQVSQPVEGELAEGNLTGTASLKVVPRGALSGELLAQRLAIAPLYDLILTASRRPGSEVMLGECQ